MFNGCLDEAFLKGEFEDTTRRIFRFLLRASPRNPQRSSQFSPELSRLMESRKIFKLTPGRYIINCSSPCDVVNATNDSQRAMTWIKNGDFVVRGLTDV